MTLRLNSKEGRLNASFTEMSKPNMFNFKVYDDFRQYELQFESSFQPIQLSEEAEKYILKKYDYALNESYIELSQKECEVFEVENEGNNWYELQMKEQYITHQPTEMKGITDQSESIIQKQCMKWMKFQYPFIMTFAVPNGGTRNVREAISMRQQGVLAGVSDLIMLRPNKTHHALCIELKTKKGRQTPEQKEFEKNVKQWNYQYSICRSLDEFMQVVNDYVMDI